MRNRLFVTVVAAALSVGALFVSLKAVALDHNDGKVPTENISSIAIKMPFPSTTILGQDFSYPSGVPLIEAFSIEIPPGKQTPLHKHAIPMYAYITAGELEVDYGSKGKRTLKVGTAFVEAINWCHFGRAVGTEPVKILAVYLGQREPNQIQPEICESAE